MQQVLLLLLALIVLLLLQSTAYKGCRPSFFMYFPLCMLLCTAPNRYLSSDISFFGVGSKNAAFYLGRTVKVVTRAAGSAFVHELCIQGACGLLLH